MLLMKLRYQLDFKMKKGTIRIPLKVMIGLILGIVVVVPLIMLGGKMWNTFFNPTIKDDIYFYELVDKIKNLEDGENENIIYFVNEKHSLVGFNKGVQSVSPREPPGTPFKFLRPKSCGDSVCICKCSNDKDGCESLNAICEVFENYEILDGVEIYDGGSSSRKIISRKSMFLYGKPKLGELPLLISGMGGDQKFPLFMERKGNTIAICEELPCIFF